MKHTQFSIIVPIYNTEKYLRKCIESILAQTYNNYELILVDNNSTDGSAKIIQEYVDKYPSKVRNFFCKKPGAAAARNLGIGHAKGEYISFVDSDDYVTKDFLEKINTAAEKNNADIVTINAKGNDSDLRLHEWSDDVKKNIIVTGPGPYCLVTRRKIWIDNDLLFREDIIYEDTAIMGSLVLYADKIAIVKETVYVIVPRPGSIMRQQTWNPKNGECIFAALDDLCGAFKKHDAFDKYHDELEQVCSVAMMYVVANCLLPFKQSKPYFERMRKYLKKNFPKWYKNKYIRKHYTFKMRTFMMLNYLNMQWAIKLITKLK